MELKHESYLDAQSRRAVLIVPFMELKPPKKLLFCYAAVS